MLERAAGGHAVHQFVTSAWRPNASAMSQIAGARRGHERGFAGAVGLVRIRADFEQQSVKLTEAGAVMSQITSLSQALVDAAGGLGASLDESSVLAQTNYELFKANRALLERELELQQMQVSKSVEGGLSCLI